MTDKEIDAILLRRKPLREYDEKLTFLTNIGSLQLISYGSKSIKSRRGKILSELNWLQIIVESKNNFLQLKNIKKSIPIISNEENVNLEFYSDFCHFLKQTESILPIENLSTKKLEAFLQSQSTHYLFFFQLLKLMSHEDIQKLSSPYRKLIFKLCFLKEQGILIEFTGCSQCFQKENQNYYFVKKNETTLTYSYLESFNLESPNYTGNFICTNCLSKLKIPTKNLLETTPTTLSILNGFLKNYQLNYLFLKRFVQFIKKKSISSFEINQLLKLGKELKKLII